MKYLWDTNILMIILRKPNIFEKWDKELKLFSAGNENFISVVAVGEIYSIAYQRDWQKKKMDNLKNLLDFLGSPLPIANTKIIQSYSKIDAYSQGKLKNNPLPTTARNMGKNDLWIAATAMAAQAELLTTDADFYHLNEVFLSVRLIKPL